jgi:predicted RNase H-like HicB family nuclease
MHRSFTAIIERCKSTELYVGWIPGFPGAHSQGATREELQRNLEEVVALLFEEGEPRFESEFVGTLHFEVR